MTDREVLDKVLGLLDVARTTEGALPLVDTARKLIRDHQADDEAVREATRDDDDY